MNSTISSKPKESFINQIHNWLKEEHETTNKGFYIKWNSSIYPAFECEDAIFLIKNNECIGFVTYTKAPECQLVHLDYVVIHYKFRKLGYGKLLTEKVMDYFSRQGFISVELLSFPPSNYTYWETLGFAPIPNYQAVSPKLYKIITPSREIATDVNTLSRLEMWNKKDIACKNIPPKWVWDLSNENNLPIINECAPNWRIRYIVNGQEKYNGEMKRFRQNSPSAYYLFNFDAPSL